MAVRAGFLKKEFLHSTLKDINLRLENYREEREYEVKKIEHLAWLTGAYVMRSIGASFSKKVKYPDSPLCEQQVVVEDMELTEEEKEAGLQNLMAKLQGMADKFKKNKGENEEKNN